MVALMSNIKQVTMSVGKISIGAMTTTLMCNLHSTSLLSWLHATLFPLGMLQIFVLQTLCNAIMYIFFISTTYDLTIPYNDSYGGYHFSSMLCCLCMQITIFQYPNCIIMSGVTGAATVNAYALVIQSNSHIVVYNIMHSSMISIQ